MELHHSGYLFLPPSGSDQLHQASVSLSIQRWLVFLLFLLCWVFVAVHRLRGFSCPKACRILVPQLGIKPGSPALEGGFLTIGPPVKVIVAQLCLTLCYPMDYSPPGSSVHGILHAKILEWVASSFSRGSS